MTILLKAILSLAIFCGVIWLIATITIDNAEEGQSGSYLVYIMFPAAISGIIAIWRYKPQKQFSSTSKDESKIHDFSNTFTDFVDYYQILHLDLGFSDIQLKEAYKAQAIKWHPDKNPDIDTTSKMQQINEAYLIFKDQSSRKLYQQEYVKYQKFCKQKIKQTQLKLEYIVQDKTLKIKILKAREEAAKLAKQSFTDMLGMTMAGGKAILNEALIRAIFWGGIFTFFTLLARACN